MTIAIVRQPACSNVFICYEDKKLNTRVTQNTARFCEGAAFGLNYGRNWPIQTFACEAGDAAKLKWHPVQG